MRGTATGLRGRRLRYSGEGYSQSARCGLQKEGGLGCTSGAPACAAPCRPNASYRRPERIGNPKPGVGIAVPSVRLIEGTMTPEAGLGPG
jgi:hypothetical protein